MEAFAHVQSDRLRIQTELLKCSKGDTGYHFIFYASRLPKILERQPF